MKRLPEYRHRDVEEWFRGSINFFDAKAFHNPVSFISHGDRVGFCTRTDRGVIISAVIIRVDSLTGEKTGVLEWAYTRPSLRTLGFMKTLIFRILNFGYRLESTGASSGEFWAGFIGYDWIRFESYDHILQQNVPAGYDTFFDPTAGTILRVGSISHPDVCGRAKTPVNVIGRYDRISGDQFSEKFSESLWLNTRTDSRMILRFQTSSTCHQTRMVLIKRSQSINVVAAETTGARHEMVDIVAKDLDLVSLENNLPVRRERWTGGWIDHIFITRLGEVPSGFSHPIRFFNYGVGPDVPLMYSVSGESEAFSLTTGTGCVIAGALVKRVVRGSKTWRQIVCIYSHPAYYNHHVLYHLLRVMYATGMSIYFYDWVCDPRVAGLNSFKPRLSSSYDGCGELFHEYRGYHAGEMKITDDGHMTSTILSAIFFDRDRFEFGRWLETKDHPRLDITGRFGEHMGFTPLPLGDNTFVINRGPRGPGMFSLEFQEYEESVKILSVRGLTADIYSVVRLIRSVVCGRGKHISGAHGSGTAVRDVLYLIGEEDEII